MTLILIGLSLITYLQVYHHNEITVCDPCEIQRQSDKYGNWIVPEELL